MFYSWVGGFSVVDTYHCNSAAYQQGPPDSSAPAGSTTQISASCSGVDTNAAPFTMNFVVYAYSYYSRGGGGKGGGDINDRARLPAADGKTFSRNPKHNPAVTNGDVSCRLEIWR